MRRNRPQIRAGPKTATTAVVLVARAVLSRPSAKTTERKTLILVCVPVLPGQALSRRMLESLVVYRRRDGARRAVALPVPLKTLAVP